jgi:YVTN family beta-propeller protein
MPRRADAPERLLTTVMFTDIVGSTQLASELGDRGWRQLVSRHHALVRKTLKRYGGHEVDTAGDGFFATFDQPTRAIACAKELVTGLRHMGIEIRAGIHMGEVEVIGAKVGGIAVHIGSRVMSKAQPGEVLVSSTVRDLMSGSETRFEDRGLQELKGVPAQWHLFAVEPEAAPETVEEGAAPEAEAQGRRSTPLIVVASLAVVAIAAVAVVLATRGGGGTAGFVPAPNTVVRLDAMTGKVAGGAHVGGTPISVAFGEGRVWVANFADRTIQPVDPATDQASGAIGFTVSGFPTGVAVGGGSVWVTSSIEGKVFKIDPSTRVPVPIDVGVGATGLAFGDGALWVTNRQQDTVLRLDPQTSQFETIPLDSGSSPKGIAVGAGSVWVANSLGGRVVRIDLTTNKVVQKIQVLKGQPEAVAFGEGYVWVTNTDDDSVTRIDPQTNQGITIANVGNGPSGVAVGDGGVWVANSLDGTVSKIDPRSAKVAQTIRIGFSPDGVAVGPGAVWVTVHSQ